MASEFGSEEVCRVLLNAKAFINSKTKAGWTALHFAAQRGHTKLVEYFVNKMGATIDSTTMKKQTPLHLAATHGRVQACQILVDLGASLDAADDNSQRAIHLAALANQVCSRSHYSKSQIFVHKFNFDKTPTFSRVFRQNFSWQFFS